MSKSKVLLLGWDAADWKIIYPLLAQGKLPALKKVMDRGAYGNMSTMNPPYSPMLWTSVATGKTPDKHGVLGFIELQPDLKGVRPVTVNSRKTRAIWNILHNQGYKSNLVGWWPSFPAEPINGVVVSDKFQKANKNPKIKIKIKPGTIHPESYLEAMKDLKMSPEEVTEAHILPFIPKAATIDQEKDKSLTTFAKILAENVSVHCAATHLMRTTDWDFMAVYYDAIDHFCHAFMKYYPPKLKAVPDKLFETYKEVITGAYLFQDMMLGRMLELVDDDTTIIIMSDHGYESGNKRILKMPKYPAAPSLEHRQFGVFVASGPQIKTNEKVFGLGLIDITPTLLHLFGLPIGKDMDGTVALDIFKDPKPPTFIESWDTIEGDFGEHKNTDKTAQFSDDETMQQLIDLGYVDKPDEKTEITVHKIRCDLKHNLARVYLGKKDYERANEILLELIKEKEPIDIVPYYMDLLTVSLQQNNYKNAENYLGMLRTINKTFDLNTYLAEARILLGNGKVNEALKLLKLAKEKKPNGGIWFQLGKIYLQLENYKEAKLAFEKALEYEIDNSKFHQALAVVLLRLGNPEEAAEHALTSIELIKYFPAAHYTLGEALTALGDLENAKIAFEMASKLKPKAHIRAEKAIENIDEALVTQSEFKDKTTFKHRKEQIVIVSGLPRSGTSLMMQMLNKGGLKVLTDNDRKADDSNPKGYFEYTPVMALHKDNTWLHLAKDNTVKVVAPLLKFLDPQYRYKIIFMNRDIHEIVKSQQKMIGKDTETLPIKLFESYKKQLNSVDIWKKKEPNVELIYVDYKNTLYKTTEVVDRVTSFIGIDMDKEKMLDCVDSRLYRTKN